MRNSGSAPPPERHDTGTRTGENLGRAARRRSLVAVIASAGAAGLTFGLTIPLLSLILEAQGKDSLWIGLNASAASLAILMVGPLVPRVLDRLGVLPAMYLSIAGAVVLILLLPLWTGLGPWFLLRFLLGALAAVHWIVSETWIVAVAASASRGRAVALYMTVMSAGFAAGPLLITLVGIEGWPPFLVSAGLIGLSAAPLVLAHGVVPKLPPRAPAAVTTAIRAAPLIMAAAVLAGLTDTAVISLLPIYGLKQGLGQDVAVLMLTVMLVGNLVLQLPLGWLADRVDRRRLVILCGVLFLLCPLALPFAIRVDVLLWPLLVIWGGVSIGIYTLALIILGERFHAAALAGANAAVVTLYECGSVLGPILGGSGMDALGPDGLMAVLAAAAAAFLGVALFRRRR